MIFHENATIKSNQIVSRKKCYVRGKLGPSSSFGAKFSPRDQKNKMADQMEVDTTTTSSEKAKDVAMEVDIPQKEKVQAKGSSGASTSSGKQSKGFELPW